MSTVKNQHTVTKAYLTRWADAARQVYVFDIETGTTRRENVSTVTARRYFYSPADGVQEVEHALSKLEGCWIAAQEALLARARVARRTGRYGPKVLYRPDKERLSDYVVVQLTRTPRVRRSLGIADPDLAREAHVDFMRRPSVAALARQIDGGIWLVCRNDVKETDLRLCTSDHPVVVIPFSDDLSSPPRRVKGFMLPLSPDHLLVIYARGATNFGQEWNGRVIPLTPDLIRQSNALHARTCDRVVIASVDDFADARAIRAQRIRAERMGSGTPAS